MFVDDGGVAVGGRVAVDGGVAVGDRVDIEDDVGVWMDGGVVDVVFISAAVSPTGTVSPGAGREVVVGVGGRSADGVARPTAHC